MPSVPLPQDLSSRINSFGLIKSRLNVSVDSEEGDESVCQVRAASW